MINNIKHFLVVSIFFLFSTNIFSQTFIDVDEFNFSQSQIKGIRVCMFDIENQQYTLIDYYPYTHNTTSESNKTLEYEYGINNSYLYIASLEPTEENIKNILLQNKDIQYVVYNNNIYAVDDGKPRILKTTNKQAEENWLSAIVANCKVNSTILLEEQATNSISSNTGHKVINGGISIKYNGDITVKKNFEHENYIVRTKGKITDQSGQVIGTNDGNGKSIFRDEFQALSGEEVRVRLNKLSADTGNRVGSEFSVDFYKLTDDDKLKNDVGTFGSFLGKNRDTMSNLKKQENSQERGIIGELATEYTMIGYGYKKLPAKNGTNGFDGVFINELADQDLFLTESKCENPGSSVGKILADFLNENTVISRTNIIPDQNTKEIVQTFIKKKPWKIFKFAHRTLPDGWCLCGIERSNPTSLTVSPINPISLSGEKRQFNVFGMYYGNKHNLDDVSKQIGVVWESSQQNIATINDKGVATANTAGITNITAKLECDAIMASNKKDLGHKYTIEGLQKFTVIEDTDILTSIATIKTHCNELKNSINKQSSAILKDLDKLIQLNTLSSSYK